jgi:NAD(P)H dehydrogenase (quinone)
MGEHGLKTGFFLPTGQGRGASALRSEMGEATANWLLTATCDYRIYKLTGSGASCLDDVAQTLTDLSGRMVKPTSIESSVSVAQLKARGLPDAVTPRFLGFQTDIKNGQEDEVGPELGSCWAGIPPR